MAQSHSPDSINLIMDVTNGVSYWDEWNTIFSVMEKMEPEGNRVPKICFWAFNGPVISVVQGLYDNLYKANKYKDLWYDWDGKPLSQGYNYLIDKDVINGETTTLMHYQPQAPGGPWVEVAQLHYRYRKKIPLK